MTFMRICFTSSTWDQANLMMLSEAGLLAKTQPAPDASTRLEFWLVSYEILPGPPSLDPGRMVF